MGSQPSGGTFFGHPKGLATLFFTEMWERFSYYGMRALLVLFMTAATNNVITKGDGSIIENGGLGLDVATAGAIYGMYTALVYILALPGGWVADNIWGQRKAVWVGGWIIALGHFTMAVPNTKMFFLGLVFIILGTGLLKPNVSTVVGELYPGGGARRDAGFSVFYMGINLGAFFGPLVTGFLGEGYHWHWGFGAAGIGMVLGLIQYRMGAGYLGNAGLLKSTDAPEVIKAREKKFFLTFFTAVAGVLGFAFLVSNGTIALSLTQIAQYLGYSVLILVAAYFVYIWTFGGHTVEENKKMGVIFWLFLLIAIFWSGFEQAGTSLNIFARDLTDRNIMGWLMPASFLQSVNAMFIIILAPLFGSLWIALEKLQKDPSIPLKAGMGLLGLAMGFFVLAWGAANASPDHLVSPAWLVVTYFLHTVGELCISPIGLSAITKLSPVNRVGQMMGIWFVGAALGNLFAGLIGGSLADLEAAALFRTVAMIIGSAGIFALIAAPQVKKLMGNLR
ncbi:MAG: peptide MFS transporter [Gemmatimonadales bacterium]|jgi:proton-dependent oligopeptide transporter, POT family|nr:peptide MFS transporter [Gemmatimonadales bacterium]MBT6373086.1 peptide MFS transporter [Gemmatimonadales bacterium]